MLLTTIVLLPFAALLPPQDATATPDPAAIALARTAIAAMGGEVRLHAIHRVLVEEHGHTNMLEQSERPEGPWIVQYEQRKLEVDFDRATVRAITKSLGMPGNPGFTGTLLFADGIAVRSFGPGRELPDPSLALEFEALLELSAPRVLSTALAARDLHAAARVRLQGSQQDVLGFTWRGAPVRILLDAHTHLPTAVEWTRADPTSLFFGVWGDVTTRDSWSFWHLETAGLRLPRQIDTEVNGQPWRSRLATELGIDPELEPVVIADATKAAFSKLAARSIQDTPLGKTAVEIGPGVVQLQNGWNTTLIEQDDGIVVLEAPYSAGYSERVISEAERRFAGKRVKAVITASDAWPHLGGVRGHVARGVPVYLLDLNQPILERLVAAPFHFAPDALARNPRQPDWRVVRDKTTIGSGRNKIELYPLRTETGERMLMAWLPDLGALYAADLVQPMGKEFFMPQYLTEVRDAAQREQLDVKVVFAMHAPPLPWSTITAAIAAAQDGG